MRNNLVTPEIFVSEIWMQEGAKNGVEIIELNSSNSEVGETPQEPTHNFSQAWSFVNHDRFRDTEEDLRINKTARERRRKKNEEDSAVAYASEYFHDHDIQTNFNGFHYIDDSEISEIPREQMNCFTIINNHVINSDSSSENEYARVDEIEPYFTENNDPKYWDHVYKDDMIKCNSTESINAEKRTVWIYSFKNNRRLSENDFELVNISSKDSTETTTSPISDEEFTIERGPIRRISSPIPATFIPRLDLSLAQTLSTVTELSEVKESSKESLVINKKPINNWFTERNIRKSKTEVANIVNWMSLSPRERRRRFKNTNSDRDHEIPAGREIFTYAEGNTKFEQYKEKSRKSSSVIHVDVEVHANDIPDAVPASDIEICSVESLELEQKVAKKKVDNTLSIDITYADADTEIDNENANFNFDSFIMPSIKVTSDKTYGSITEPIEKLNNSQWIIGDENIEEQTADFDYLLDANENIENESIRSIDACDSASKRLWVKNAKLMKSPLWTEYLPITGTPQSLHLSLSLSSIEVKKSWFKRIGKYFKCCK